MVNEEVPLSRELIVDLRSVAEEALRLLPGKVNDHVTVIQAYLQLISASPDKMEYVTSLRKTVVALADVAEMYHQAEFTERLDSLIRRMQ
jgi:hypothetical protein